MKVGIVALLHESNTFSPGPTTLADFAADLLLTGEEIRDQLADSHHEVGGFFAGLAEAGIEAVPIFAARAIPWGPIQDDDFQELMRQLLAAFKTVGPLDGVLAAVHGATVSEKIRDVDGHWLTAVRQHIGPDVPLIGTLDPHANLSPTMVVACDALVAYNTNPHLDQRDRGLEAAELMARTLRGEIRPTMAAAFPPLAINIECQNTSEPPCHDWFEMRTEIAALPAALSASSIMGFPYADVEEMGAATIVVTNNDAALAQQEANRLAHWLWDNRADFNRQPTSVAQAVDEAGRSRGPTCLLDIGDNIGGGGPGDTTCLARTLADQSVRPSLVVLHDPEAVRLATHVGVGQAFFGELGGRNCTSLSGLPLRGNFRVKSLVAGKFSEARPRHGGWVDFDQGPTAVLESDNGLTAIVNSLRTPPFSLAQITSCGVDPNKFQAIIAKGVHAPVAAYREVCQKFVRVDTPGVTSANMTRFSYRHRRTPMFPFESECQWELSES